MKTDETYALLKRRSNIYERKAFFFLQFSWLIWISVTILGIAITIIELTVENNRTIVAILGGVTTGLGLTQTKFKPYKRGYKYKLSANRIRELTREYQRLKTSTLPQDELEFKLEKIYRDMEELEIEIYTINSVESVVV